MIDKISMTCSECGKILKMPEYGIHGLPYEFLRCGCNAETKINPRRMNSKWWEGVWMYLVFTMRREFGDAVADRLVEFIIERRNYVRDRDYCHDAFEPQNLEKQREKLKSVTKQDKPLRTRDRNEGFIPR